MAADVELGVLKEYIEAVGSSSSRVRAILIIQIVASIIVASVVWNQQLWSWTRGEIAQTKAALEWFKRHAEGKSIQEIRMQIREARERNGCDRPEVNSVECTRSESLQRAEGLFAYYESSATSAEQIRKYLDELVKIDISLGTVVDIHALGIKFHSNDNGIIGGITLVIMVAWLRLALWRHASNLELTFSRASERGCLKACYELVAMRQVFTLPMLDAEGGRHKWIEKPSAATGLLLYALPLLVQVTVVLWDVSSIQAGGFSSLDHATVSVFVSSVLLLAIAWLMFNCIRLQTIIAITWAKWHSRLSVVRS
jgi:hypothetical protein